MSLDTGVLDTPDSVRLVRGFISTGSSEPATIIVGEGMIGTAISVRARRRSHDAEWVRPSDWTDPQSIRGDFENAMKALSPPPRVSVVWCAGQADMKSEGDEHLAVDAFRAGVGGLVEAARAIAPTTLHLISSAGALGAPLSDNRFELIDSPYRRLKAAEEFVVGELHDDVRIHRVSSVFAAPRGAARTGVIGMLVANALRGSETPLFARTVTMRNYLHADDVAEAIVRATSEDDRSPTLIAARRSHAMNEVVATVRNVVRRPVPINYRPPVNDHDMVFDPRAVSPLVPQRPLAAGVRLVYDAIVGR